jgi:fibronectin-binding autotransporter adhesin
VNYSGKFDAKIPADGLGLHSPGQVHVETVHATQVPADAIVVEDAHLLFNAQFKRSGVDLVLSKDDSELVLHDYFKGEKRATLASPDGAHLTAMSSMRWPATCNMRRRPTAMPALARSSAM